MRTNKKLLELMLENQQLFDKGLCHWTSNMVFTIITFDEKKKLDEYIFENKPITFYRMLNAAYWWKRGDIKPRIKWIEKHIKKLS